MSRVAALLDKIFGGAVLHADLDELMLSGVILPEVSAEAALAFLNGLHLPFLL